MNNIFSKINIGAFIKKYFDRDSEKIDPSPSADWMIIIVLFITFSVVSTLFYSALFLPQNDISSTKDVAIAPELSTENISKTKLDKTLAPWEGKSGKFDEYFNSRPTFDFMK